MRSGPRWRSLFAWAVVLGLADLTLITAMSVGVFLLPVAAVVLVLVARRSHAWPESMLGGLIGLGAVCCFVAYRNRAYAPCLPAGTPIQLAAGERLTCGGFAPMPWLAVGALLLLVGLATYLIFSLRTSRGG
jgi:hypothetical protein